MLKKNDKEYYPLEVGTIKKDSKTYYSRNARDKPYFYLVLRTNENTPGQVPANP